jgi:hypothetical protein
MVRRVVAVTVGLVVVGALGLALGDMAETCERTPGRMAAAAAFLIVLVEVAVIFPVLYLAVRFGVATE